MVVCFDVKMYALDDQRWSLGYCSDYYGDPVTPLSWKPFEKIITTRCCLAEETYLLECAYEAQWEQVWKQSYLDIQGHKYCDDFIGLRAFRLIDISGNILTIGIYINIYSTPVKLK